MDQPTEEQKELLVKFIERHIIFFDTYANWVLVFLGVGITLLIYLSFKYVKYWPIRILAVASLFFILIINVLFILLINIPLKPFIKSMAVVSRSIDSIPPRFQFKNVRSNETLTLEQFKGKVVILNFWGTYCGPCLEEMPDLQRVEAELQGDVVVISLSDESEDRITQFIKTHNAPGIVGYFTNGDWITLGTFRPLTIYFDRTGKVREYLFGKSDYDTFKSRAMKYLSPN